MMIRFALYACACLILCSCTSAPEPQLLSCATPDDQTASADVTLTARDAVVEPVDGVRFVAWTYDGDAPGPVLRMKPGETRRIKLVNASPRPVSIHFHGMSYPQDDDGTQEFPKGVANPGCAHVYTITARKPGVWPYHSHLNTRVELARGLYGAIVVADPDESPADHEFVMFMGQLGLEGAGAGEAAESEEASEGEGTEASGFAMTLNGRAFPKQKVIELKGGGYAVTEPSRQAARVGQLVRWRVVNVSPDDIHTFGIHAHGFCDRGGVPDAKGACPADGQNINIADLTPLKGTTLEYIEDKPGLWMFHCHIIDHANDGMMGYYEVGE